MGACGRDGVAGRGLFLRSVRDTINRPGHEADRTDGANESRVAARALHGSIITAWTQTSNSLRALRARSAN